MSELGILHMRLGPGKHLHGVDLMGGAVKGEEFDYFHDLIVAQELARAMARGFADGNMAGMTIGLTAVLNFARDEAWKNKIAGEVFSGKKKICLAITEAFAGSDVAGLRTTAEKTPDGKHYVSQTRPSATMYMELTRIRSSMELRSGSPTVSGPITSSPVFEPTRALVSSLSSAARVLRPSRSRPLTLPPPVPLT